MGLSREEHLKIAAQQRADGLDVLAAVHEREAAKSAKRPATAYTLRTVFDQADGEQVELEIGFNLRRGYPGSWGRDGGSPPEPPEVDVRWMVRLDTGADMEWDDFSAADQERFDEACLELHDERSL